jgi:short-subunit dehydrogenase
MNDRPVSVVTGASSGIGRETAVALAGRGHCVVLAARRVERLEAAAEACRRAGGQAVVRETDVAVEAQLRELIEGTERDRGRIDVLVNNAGFGIHARVHETDPRQMREIFEVNFFAVFQAVRLAAPGMIRRRSGHIFNVSSVIGKRGAPLNGAYSATKFAVCGLSDSMRVELAPYGVRVTCVCPGLTDTEFFENVRNGRSGARSSFERLRSLTPPSQVARRIAASIGRDVPEMVFTPGGRLLTIIACLWPKLADRMMKVYHDDLIDRGR